MTENPCTICGKPGIPGLIKGAGKCQYHYDVGQYGKEWADHVHSGKDNEGFWPPRYEALDTVDAVMSAYANDRDVRVAPPGVLEHPSFNWFVDPPGMRTRAVVEESIARGWLYRDYTQKTP